MPDTSAKFVKLRLNEKFPHKIYRGNLETNPGLPADGWPRGEVVEVPEATAKNLCDRFNTDDQVFFEVVAGKIGEAARSIGDWVKDTAENISAGLKRGDISANTAMSLVKLEQGKKKPRQDVLDALRDFLMSSFSAQPKAD